MHRPCLLATALLLACLPGVLLADPLKIAGAPVEFQLATAAGRTLQFKIVPLDDAGRPRPDPATGVFIDFPTTSIATLRELAAPRVFQAGPLKLTLAALSGAYTLTATTTSGKPLQQLTISQSDASITFLTSTPLFGLGEGRQAGPAGDRRGFYFNFINGDTRYLATAGAAIPVPFLISPGDADHAGWSLFFHNPPPRPVPPINAREANQPWCTFDLRGPDPATGNWLPPPNEGRAPSSNNPIDVPIQPPATLPTLGKFTPRAATLLEAPIQLYLTPLDQPADALAAFTHLTGHAVMPPKWALGYMQSHRSLAPGEPL